ncbi:MAG: FeoA domain-containing protein [Phycisphaerales bacterium]|nr:MAG: FeoA domain-containing protein [Phycisphaerales bacterium]
MPVTAAWIISALLALCVVAAIVLWPRRGLLGWVRGLRATRQRILAEDALKHIHSNEWSGQQATLELLAGSLRRSARKTVELVTRMEAQGWVRSTADGLSLTPEGERLALQVIRAHRLWERYLADEARMALTDVHEEAERLEHQHSPDTLDALEAAMGHPMTDPHGDPIPTSNGKLARVSAESVSNWPLKTPGRIVHLEDEPAAIFAQIVALGLRLGQIVWVTEVDTKRVVLSDGRETYVIAPVVAANIFVVATEPEREPVPIRRLTALRPGQSATVRGLDEAMQGFTRRRLLDLGITPGVTIAAEMSSMTRDPTAYRVRGSLIALRRDQARYVFISPDGNGGPRDT